MHPTSWAVPLPSACALLLIYASRLLNLPPTKVSLMTNAAWIRITQKSGSMFSTECGMRVPSKCASVALISTASQAARITSKENLCRRENTRIYGKF